MEILNEYMIPVISGICLCVGYITKQWIKDVQNKYIPTIVAVLGIFLSVWLNEWQLTPEVILCGLISGLGSTGMHQMLKQFMENKE